MFISRPVSSTFLKVTISQYNPVYFHTIKMSIPVDEIPIIPLMYRLKELQPPDSLGGDNEISIPSQKLNNKIATIRGDITKLAVDAIVNAANNSLLGGGGVDGAIHRAAGRGLVKECQTLGGCATGSAKITDAYELPCKNVIHAVGPVYKQWKSPTSAKVLAGCYTKGLELAAQNDCKSIAFSAISTGIYGYPSMEAASVALRAVKEFLEGENGDKIEKVVFCTFEMKDVIAYRDWIP
jgi:O-acetyl-ADP-ribose deacetylase (regulator of RNase III)